MIPLTIKFQPKDSKEPVWPEAAVNYVDAGILGKVAVLEKGMESGAPSVAFLLRMPDGRFVVAQQTAKQMVTLARLIMIKYPNLMD